MIREFDEMITAFHHFFVTLQPTYLIIKTETMSSDNEQIRQNAEPVITEEQARLQGEQMAREAESKARKDMLKSVPGMMAENAVKRELNEVISHALPDEVNRLRWAGILRNIPIVSDIVQWADNLGMLRRLFGKTKEE